MTYFPFDLTWRCPYTIQDKCLCWPSHLCVHLLCRWGNTTLGAYVFHFYFRDHVGSSVETLTEEEQRVTIQSHLSTVVHNSGCKMDLGYLRLLDLGLWHRAWEGVVADLDWQFELAFSQFLTLSLAKLQNPMSSNCLLRIRQASWWFLLSFAPQPKGFSFDSHKSEDVHCRSFWCASSSPPSWVHWGLLLSARKKTKFASLIHQLHRSFSALRRGKIFPKDLKALHFAVASVVICSRWAQRHHVSGNDTLGRFESGILALPQIQLWCIHIAVTKDQGNKAMGHIYFSFPVIYFFWGQGFWAIYPQTSESNIPRSNFVFFHVAIRRVSIQERST